MQSVAENRDSLRGIYMDVDEVVQYWVDLAEADWPVVDHLFASGDYNYALFFGHLYLEKRLKALVVKITQSHAPRTHNLLFLAECACLTLPEDKRDVLVRVTAYSIETRYPEANSVERKRYTQEYCQREIVTIREIGKWLKSELKREMR
ncbi:HEPN domain-containing protein [Candidatus Poribacteria bacterium]